MMPQRRRSAPTCPRLHRIRIQTGPWRFRLLSRNSCKPNCHGASREPCAGDSAVMDNGSTVLSVVLLDDGAEYQEERHQADYIDHWASLIRVFGEQERSSI